MKTVWSPEVGVATLSMRACSRSKTNGPAGLSLVANSTPPPVPLLLYWVINTYLRVCLLYTTPMRPSQAFGSNCWPRPAGVSTSPSNVQFTRSVDEYAVTALKCGWSVVGPGARA